MLPVVQGIEAGRTDTIRRALPDSTRPLRLARQVSGPEKASDWFVRMHSDDVTEVDRRAHGKWLADNVKNQAQYVAVQRSLRDLAVLDHWMRDEVNRLNARAMERQGRRTKVWVAGCASAAAVLAVVAFWATLSPTSRYETERAEQREISLDDGSRIHLNTASSVDVRFTRDKRKVELNRGEGIFDVSHDVQRPFVVAAADAEIVAVGTRFRVRLTDGEVIVTVLEGAVAVFRPGQSATDPYKGVEQAGMGTALLYPNDQLTVTLDDGMTDVETVDATAAMAWREGKLIFDATPLRQAVEEISRYTLIDVAVSDDMPDHLITGLIQIRSPDAMIRFISNAVSVTPVKVSANRIVLHPKP